MRQSCSAYRHRCYRCCRQQFRQSTVSLLIRKPGRRRAVTICLDTYPVRAESFREVMRFCIACFKIKALINVPSRLMIDIHLSYFDEVLYPGYLSLYGRLWELVKESSDFWTATPGQAASYWREKYNSICRMSSGLSGDNE